MTVEELREALMDYDDDEAVPLSAVVPDLSYVVSALEQYLEIGDLFGRQGEIEVHWFLEAVYASL